MPAIAAIGNDFAVTRDDHGLQRRQFRGAIENSASAPCRFRRAAVGVVLRQDGHRWRKQVRAKEEVRISIQACWLRKGEFQKKRPGPAELSREIDGHVTSAKRKHLRSRIERRRAFDARAFRPADLSPSGGAAQARHGQLAAAGDQHAGSAFEPAVLEFQRQETGCARTGRA